MNDVYLSVIAAAYNERDNLPTLIKEIAEALSYLDKPWEILIIDDASTDDSLEVLNKLMGEYPQLRVLKHIKNAGQSAGWDSGFRAARGQLYATLDADLQNNPTGIPILLKAVEADECDLANGWRKERNDPWIRLVSTRIANGFRNKLTNESIHDSACGLKVFKRECVERMPRFNGMHRFMPTLVKMKGYRVKEIPVHHRPRIAGEAKYGVGNRLFRGLRDCFAIRWMQARNICQKFEEVKQD